MNIPGIISHALFLHGLEYPPRSTVLLHTTRIFYQTKRVKESNVVFVNGEIHEINNKSKKLIGILRDSKRNFKGFSMQTW